MAFRSDLLRLLDERGYIHQITDAEGLDALAAAAGGARLYRLRRDRALAPCRQPGPDHAAAPAAAGRAQADRADGRRHHQDRRSLAARTRAASCSPPRRSTPTSPRSARVFERFLTFGDGPTDAVMVDNADWLDAARLHPVPARRRPAFHDQPHADLRFGQAAARPRAAADLPRIQLHDPAGLRFPASCRGARLPAAARRLRPVGQHRQRRRAGRRDRRRRGLRPDHAADHHRRRRARWARPRRARSGSTTTSSPPTITGSSGATPRTRDVGRFLRLFTDLPLDEIARLEALEGAEINDAKKVLADAATAMLHGDDAAARRAETARKTFEEGAGGEDLPTLKVAGSIGLVDALVGLGLVASKNEARRLIAQGGAQDRRRGRERGCPDRRDRRRPHLGRQEEARAADARMAFRLTWIGHADRRPFLASARDPASGAGAHSAQLAHRAANSRQRYVAARLGAEIDAGRLASNCRRPKDATTLRIIAARTRQRARCRRRRDALIALGRVHSVTCPLLDAAIAAAHNPDRRLHFDARPRSLRAIMAARRCSRASP